MGSSDRALLRHHERTTPHPDRAEIKPDRDCNTKRGDRMPGGALSLTATALDGGGHLVTVAGEVDLATAPQLAEYLTHFEDGPLTVDLSGVSFLDSSGIATLLTAHRRRDQHRSRLTIRGATPIVLEVLH